MQNISHHRIKWIDFGKGFTILLVIVAHTLGGIYTNYIYNGYINSIIKIIGETLFLFIMPVFFSLSGYLFKNPKSFSDYLLMVKKKAWNLLVPYVVFSIIYVLLSKVGGKNTYTWNSLFKIYIVPISYLWFLYILFFIFVLVGVVSLFRVCVNVQIFIYLLIFLVVKLLGIKVYIFDVFCWAVFFCLGIIFRNILPYLRWPYYH